MIDDLKPTLRRHTQPLKDQPAAPAVPDTAAPAVEAAAVVPAPSVAPDGTNLPASESKRSVGTGQLGLKATANAVEAPVAALVPLLDPAAANAVEELNARSKALKAAQDAARALDEELAQAMAKVGPALTPEQQQAFVDAFKAKHAETYAAVGQAEAAMAETLATKQEALVDAFLDGHIIDAMDIAESLGAVAPSNASAIVAFGAALLADPRAAAEGHGERIVETFIAPNLASAAAEAARANDPDGTNPQTAAQAAHAAMAEPLGSALALYEQHAGTITDLAGPAAAALGAVKALQESIVDFGKVAAAGEDYFQHALAEYAQKWQGANGVGKAMAIAGLVIGLAQVGGDLLEGDLQGAVQGLLMTADDALQVMLGMEAVVKAIGPAWANVGARCVPLLGAVTNAWQAYDYAQDGKYGQATGMIISAVGGVMLAAGTGGAGLVVIAAGQAVVAAVNFADAMAEHQAQKSDYTDILVGIGVDPKLAVRLADQTDEHVKRVADRLGISTAELAVILQQPGMEALLEMRLPAKGDASLDEGHPVTDFLRQAFQNPDGTFDGRAFVAFMQEQVAAGADMGHMAANLAGAKAEMGSPKTPAEFAAAFERYRDTFGGRWEREMPAEEFDAMLKAYDALMGLAAAKVPA